MEIEFENTLCISRVCPSNRMLPRRVISSYERRFQLFRPLLNPQVSARGYLYSPDQIDVINRVRKLSRFDLLNYDKIFFEEVGRIDSSKRVLKVLNFS